MTRVEYAREVLKRIGAPRSRRNLFALLAWMQAEGGTALCNPLNTTQHMPGSTRYNSADVQNYPSFEVGIEATVKTLNYGYYDLIRARLKKQPRGARAFQTLRAVEASPWGTGGLAKLCLAYVRSLFHENGDKQIAS